ncbi:M81 family metallopeptidase [Chitinimonas arctica]|uniref:Microcystinase C n=1 Tax=Chitinimonas arctica TaxID=2594795 RepID=A0A516SCD3_9NEIS|nr:M81 family metallopeptidase [Chitinimonas arctica]QDQ25813.1 M81 family metallopeptidase [Chitinimonas arctica]
MARIGIAGFLHETNTFAASLARFTTFAEADAWPALQWGEELFASVAGVNIPVAGFVDAIRAQGHTPVPLLWASANPSGPVSEDAFEAVWWLLQRALAEAGPLDALFLDLHGAMVCEHLHDGEGELLARLRKLLGSALPILASLDFHANISQEMVALSDALLVYRTYPHVDMAATGGRAAALLPALLGGERFHKVLRPLPFLIPMPWQCTLVEPMQSLMTLSADLEGEGIAAAAFVPGFPLADTVDSGPAVLVHGRDPATTDAIAARLFEAVLAVRDRFAGKLWQPAAAVAHAIRHGQPGRTIVLADSQDNPGGGGDSNRTEMIDELLRQSAHACVGLLCDAEAAAAAHAAGPGGFVPGGFGVGVPLPGPWRVAALGDGRLVGTGPFYAGCHMQLGPMARLERDGVSVLLSSRKQQAADQAMFRHLGIEPSEQSVLVLKSSVHFRADFGALAAEILLVAAPGANVADLRELTYRYCRRRPLA